MKSPITGLEMKFTKEQRSMIFRKETFDIVFHYYQCEDSREQFTSAALDELNMNQVYNQYRDKFNIPFPDEINNIRSKYGLSASKMSEILGFGVNSYRQYEAGEIPSVANAKLIQMVDDPQNFMEMTALCGTLDEKARGKYIQKAIFLAEEKKRNISNKNEIDIFTTEFPQGYIGEQFKAKNNRPFRAELFSENELNVLEKVATVFKPTSTNEMIELSHLEEAWKKNEKNKSVISYEYAFDLNQM